MNLSGVSSSSSSSSDRSSRSATAGSTQTNPFNWAEATEAHMNHPKILKQMMLELRFAKLFERNVIQAAGDRTFSNVPDVGMDKFMIRKGAIGAVASSHAATCYIICARGKDKTTEELVLGTCHASALSPPESVLKVMFTKMRTAGCSRASIKQYVLGGQDFNYDSDDEESGTVATSEKYLKWSKRYFVKEVRLGVNPSSEDSIHVVNAPEGIFYASRPLFTVDPFGVGQDLFERE